MTIETGQSPAEGSGVTKLGRVEGVGERDGDRICVTRRKGNRVKVRRSGGRSPFGVLKGFGIPIKGHRTKGKVKRRAHDPSRKATEEGWEKRGD